MPSRRLSGYLSPLALDGVASTTPFLKRSGHAVLTAEAIMVLASGRSQSQHGTQCSLHFGCCLLFLVYCAQLPLSACCSPNISCTLQLCISAVPCLRFAPYIHTHTHFVALFVAFSSGDQLPSSRWDVGVCSLLPTPHCHAIPSFHVEGIHPLRFSYTVLKDLDTDRPH